MKGCVELSHSRTTLTKRVSIVKALAGFLYGLIYRQLSSPCDPTRTERLRAPATTELNCPTLLEGSIPTMRFSSLRSVLPIVRACNQ